MYGIPCSPGSTTAWENLKTTQLCLSLIPSSPSKLWLTLFPSHLGAGENECPGEVYPSRLTYLWISWLIKQFLVSLAGRKMDSSKANKRIWLFSKLKNGVKGLRTLSRYRDPRKANLLCPTHLSVLMSLSSDPGSSANLSSIFLPIFEMY